MSKRSMEVASDGHVPGRTWTLEQKEQATKRELERLRKVFRDLPEDKRRVADGLIKEAAFMRATLEETRVIIDREGVIERFEQGSQRFLREHPATKVYAALVNRYTAVIKQLMDQLPDRQAEGDAAKEVIEVDRRGAGWSGPTYNREYWGRIQAGEIVVSRRVRQQMERVVKDLENPPDPWVFDEDKANRPIEFIERFCRQSKGKWIGKPLHLELFQ